MVGEYGPSYNCVFWVRLYLTVESPQDTAKLQLLSQEIITGHNSADSRPASNLVRINEDTMSNYQSHDLKHDGNLTNDSNNHFKPLPYNTAF